MAADMPKYNNGSFISDFKSNFSTKRPEKSVSLAYGLIFTFIVLTTFLAFAPNSNSSFIYGLFITKPSVSISVLEQRTETLLHSLNQTGQKQVQRGILPGKVGVLEQKNETILPFNQTAVNDNRYSDSSNKVLKNGRKGKKGMKEVIKSLMKCDLYDGNWVRDESYPLYKPGSCSLIDEQFDCFHNGRPDTNYLKFKWKPKGCTLPRLNGRQMLIMLRGKRLVFVGDSLNRNMWESLVCILKNSVKDRKKVYEEYGRYHFRNEASYSFVFEDYNSTIEFFVSPFLVQQSESSDNNETRKQTLRLDLMANLASNYSTADIIVFNSGNWWSKDKTSFGKNFYQEGSHLHPDLDVKEAFRKGLTTWGRWVDANVNPLKSLVLFRGFSKSHFRGGRWNSGGACGNETEPIMSDNYLTNYPTKMKILESVMRGMKTQVTYLNVTKMTDYRKDGHPSVYRTQNSSLLTHQDCSHWCLPGVPDAWNELLYAELLVKLYSGKQH